MKNLCRILECIRCCRNVVIRLLVCYVLIYDIFINYGK